MRSRGAFSLCLLVSIAALFGDAARITFADAPVTLQQIADAVSKQRDGISDLSVTFVAKTTKDADGNCADPYCKSTVVTKGTQICVDRTITRPVDGKERTYRRIICFDGQSTYLLDGNVLATQKGQGMEAQTKTQDFFDLMMLNPEQASGGQNTIGFGDESLIALVKSPYATIRPEHKTIDQHDCVIVDLNNATGKGVFQSVWLDCDKGYLPIRQVYWHHSIPQQPSLRFDIFEATKIGEFWFAAKGRKQVFDDAGRISFEREIVIEENDDKKPLIMINSSIPDEYFQLISRAPAGTIVIDPKTGDGRKIPLPGGL